MNDDRFSGAGPVWDDHWLMSAEANDLTIEGYRLLAQEIGFEARLAWRWVVGCLRLLVSSPENRGTTLVPATGRSAARRRDGAIG